MRVLAFDTCFDACSVCVARHGADGMFELAHVSERFAAGHAEKLMPFVDESLRRAGLAVSDVDLIAVTTGPGTFTGTRIGVAAARGLALATRIKIVSTTSLAVMAEVAAGELKRSGLASDFAITVDARRDQAYVQFFGAGGLDPKSPLMLLSIDEAARAGGEGPLCIAGSAAEKVAAAAARYGRNATAHLAALLPESTALAQMAVSLPVADGAPVPLYLRPPDAKPQDRKIIARAES